MICRVAAIRFAPRTGMSHRMENFRTIALVHAFRSCPLFAGIGSDVLEAIAGFSRLKKLEKGDYLFHRRQCPEGFYVVQMGAINVHRFASDGKERVIHVFRAPESFAEAYLATDTRFFEDARALDSSTVITVPKREFLTLVLHRPELGLRIVASLSRQLQELESVLEDRQSKDVETRLAEWLLRHIAEGTSRMAVRLETTKSMIASEVGTSRETLSRTFAKFRKAGWLEVKGRYLTLLDRAGLEGLRGKNSSSSG